MLVLHTEVSKIMMPDRISSPSSSHLATVCCLIYGLRPASVEIRENIGPNRAVRCDEMWCDAMRRINIPSNTNVWGSIYVNYCLNDIICYIIRLFARIIPISLAIPNSVGNYGLTSNIHRCACVCVKSGPPASSDEPALHHLDPAVFLSSPSSCDSTRGTLAKTSN